MDCWIRYEIWQTRWAPSSIDQAQSDNTPLLMFLRCFTSTKWAYHLFPHHQEKFKKCFKQAIPPCHTQSTWLIRQIPTLCLQPLLSRQRFLPSQRYSFPLANRMKMVGGIGLDLWSWWLLYNSLHLPHLHLWKVFSSYMDLYLLPWNLTCILFELLASPHTKNQSTKHYCLYTIKYLYKVNTMWGTVDRSI